MASHFNDAYAQANACAIAAPIPLDTVYVHTYPVGVNVTLSLPEELVEEARKVARAHGLSLNGLLRSELERVTGKSDHEALLAELKRLWAIGGGRSRGRKWTREEIYDRAVLRRHQRPRLR